MKSYIYLFLSIFLFLLISCDTEGEDMYSGYISFTTSFVYPTDAYDNYRVVFNGYEITKGKSMQVDRKNPTGTLEVYQIGSNTPEFSKEITVEANDTVRLIKLDGELIDVYSEEDYISFNVNIIYSNEGQENLYKVVFNDLELNNGVNYMSKKDDLTGSIEIYKEEETIPVFSKAISLDSGSSINIMQLSETEFLSVPTNDEPDPESERYTKVRFFYTSDGIPDVASVKLIVYATDYGLYSTFAEIGSIEELKVGELSAYLTCDWQYFTLINGKSTIFLYDLINLATGEKIVDHTVKKVSTSLSQSSNWKFATQRIISSGKKMTQVSALCSSW